MNFEHTLTPSLQTANWGRDLIQQLLSSVRGDSWWSQSIADCIALGPTKSSLHLAVFVEPYLSLLMAGAKTIESRFSRNYVAPFGLLKPGDVVLLKRAGADVVGIARVGQVKFLERSDPSWNKLRDTYQDQLCVTDDEFWDRVADSWFGSLIWFDRLKPIPSIECDKNDRRGWVVIKHSSDQLALGFE